MTPLDKYDITELLATKTFAELTADERQFVLDELGSEQEYHEMYTVVNGAQQMDDIPPSTTLHTNIMDAFDKEHADDRKVIPFYVKNKGKLIAMLASAAILTIVFIAGIQRMSNETNELAEARTSKVLKSKDTTSTSAESSPTQEEIESADEQNLEPVLKSVESKAEAIAPSEEIPSPMEMEVAEEISLEIDEPKADDSFEYEILEDMASNQMEPEEKAEEAAEAKDDMTYMDGAHLIQREKATITATTANATTLESVSARGSKKSVTAFADTPFTLKMAIPSSNHYTSY